MRKIMLSLAVLFVFVSFSRAAEKKPVSSVQVERLTADTMATPQGTGKDHMALVWWIPAEFWEAVLSQDPSLSPADKQVMIDAMSGISLLVVSQADITTLGSFRFYAKEETEQRMKIVFTGADGIRKDLTPLKRINPDLEIVLAVFKPILASAMGNFGNNLHFHVMNDADGAGRRILDPYQEGRLEVSLAKKTGVVMSGVVEMPLNSLFIPRQCPNGKEAHISWKYCPWTGGSLGP